MRAWRGRNPTQQIQFRTAKNLFFFSKILFLYAKIFSGCCGSSKETREFAAVQVQLSRQRRSDAIKEFSTGTGVGAGVFRPLLSSEKNETFKYREKNGSLKQLVERESRVFRVEPEHFALCSRKNIQTATFFAPLLLSSFACFYCSTIVRSSVALAALHCVSMRQRVKRVFLACKQQNPTRNLNCSVAHKFRSTLASADDVSELKVKHLSIIKKKRRRNSHSYDTFRRIAFAPAAIELNSQEETTQKKTARRKNIALFSSVCRVEDIRAEAASGKKSLARSNNIEKSEKHSNNSFSCDSETLWKHIEKATQ